MEIVLITKVFVLIAYYELCQGLQLRMKSSMFSKDSEACVEQSKSPYFDIDQVVGKPWRIYYSWNVLMEDKCLDVIIQNATMSVVNRIYNDMHEYLESQPVWDAATLHVTMGTAKHELLLLADQGAAGRFLGVPNVMKDGNITPIRNTVPLLKFFLKLVNGGKFLLMIDCQVGVASLMSRKRPPNMLDVASAVKTLNLRTGTGQHACLSEKKKEEDFLVL